MDVVGFALKHNLRQKILFISPIISVLTLISVIITVLESYDFEITVLFASLFIFSIIARIYTKLIDPDTLELRDWGWDKRQQEFHRNIEDWRDETVMMLKKELGLSLEEAHKYVDNSINCRGEEIARQAPTDFVKTAKRLGLSFYKDDKEPS